MPLPRVSYIAKFWVTILFIFITMPLELVLTLAALVETPAEFVLTATILDKTPAEFVLMLDVLALTCITSDVMF